jgi:ADP-ribose pyrophosphatase YjhB (NUDIX family)
MKSILYLLDSVRAIAQTGLNFARDPYDKDHYQKLLNLCADEYREISNINKKQIADLFSKDLGYITTKVGSNGVILNESGQILLEKRKDDDSWAIPGGWVDATDTPEESCIREMKEETGYDVKIIKLLGVCSRTAGSYNTPHSSTHLIYLCEITSGELKVSFESHDVAFWSLDDVPGWHRDHLQWFENCIKNK